MSAETIFDRKPTHARLVSCHRLLLVCLAGAMFLFAGCPEQDMQEATANGANDDWIVTEIKGEVLALPDVHDIDLGVESEQGHVTLTGDVNSEEQREQIEEIARGVEGVQEVENRIEVSQE